MRYACEIIATIITFCFCAAYYSRADMLVHRAPSDNVKTDPLQIQYDLIGHRPTI